MHQHDQVDRRRCSELRSRARSFPVVRTFFSFFMRRLSVSWQFISWDFCLVVLVLRTKVDHAGKARCDIGTTPAEDMFAQRNPDCCLTVVALASSPVWLTCHRQHRRLMGCLLAIVFACVQVRSTTTVVVVPSMPPSEIKYYTSSIIVCVSDEGQRAIRCLPLEVVVGSCPKLV